MKISEAINIHQFLSIQEVMEISQAMETQYDQIHDKEKNA